MHLAKFLRTPEGASPDLSKILNTQKYAESMPELLTSTEKLFGEIPALLKAAENTSFEGRKFTYARGGPGGVIPFREAAEKSWIVLSQATDVLVERFLKKVPKGSYDRRLALRELETRWPELASKHFYDRYGALQYYVRNNQNYYSSLDLEMLRFEVERLGNYVADVKAAVPK
jgi:hypothetical protein